MRRKNIYATAEQKRELILRGESVPTSIFVASKERNYIEKPRGLIFNTPKNDRYLKLDKIK